MNPVGRPASRQRGRRRHEGRLFEEGWTESTSRAAAGESSPAAAALHPIAEASYGST